MNSKVAVFLALLLVISGIVIAVSDKGGKEAGPGRAAGIDDPRVDGGGRRRSSSSKGDPMAYLQSVAKLDLNDAPTFVSLEAMAGQLSIEQIRDLLSNHDSHEALSGWLRSALWAELGRRNHRESLELLIDQLGGKSGAATQFSDDQAIFAFLRGRAESLVGFDESVDAVIGEINLFSSKTESRHWQTKAVSVLFEKLAAIDHEAAWDLLQGPCLNEGQGADVPGLFASKQTAAMTGFFRSLPNEELVSSYLGEWERVLDLPEVKKSYEIYNQQINSTLSGFIAIPPEETIMAHALASLARFDPAGALEWLADHQVDPEKPDYNRIHGMWRQLATRHPDEALEIFAREEYVDARRSNIGWLLGRDFSKTADVIAATPKASHQAQILGDLLHSAGSNHVNDFFPTPEGPNRLPNFQQRYDRLLEAIDLGTFPEKQKESLIKRLDREFQGKLTPAPAE